jgi:hypothetical protein
MRLRSPRNSKTRPSLRRRETFPRHESRSELLPCNRRRPLRAVDELLAAMCQLTNRIRHLGNVLVETELRGHRWLAPHLVRRAAETSRPVLRAHEVRDLVRGVWDRVHQAPEVQDQMREVRDRVHQAAEVLDQMREVRGRVPQEHGAPLQLRRAHRGPHRVS